jgi:hypothetical protein
VEPYTGLTAVLSCSGCSRHASGPAKPRSGLHSHSSKLLSHGSGENGGCSGLETEMDFREVRLDAQDRKRK